MPDTRCPECKSADVTEIVYGFVLPSPELDRALKEGRAVLGGCSVSPHSPSHECNACFYSWQDPGSGPEQSPDA